MTVRSIDTRRDDAHKGNQWKVDKARVGKAGADSKDVSYQTFFAKAVMAYKN